jgi:tetratricopeptide (TPR) repeat protein
MAKLMLAVSDVESGNLEPGYKSFKEILDTSLRVFGQDHVFTSYASVTAALGLFGVATDSGHQEEAFGWLNCLYQGVQKTIERSLRIEGGPLLIEGDLYHRFATVYCYLGQVGKALPYAKRSVQMYERDNNVGDTPNKLEVKQMVASLYSQLGQRDKALTILKEMCKEAKKKLGSSHPTTKLAKTSLAETEDYWSSGVDPSDVQAQMTASKGRLIATGSLYRIVDRKDLDGTPIEIRLFSREKRQYLVQMAGGDRSQSYVKPSNIILDTDTPVYVHGLQNAKQYNGEEGATRDYSNMNGRYTVELGSTNMENKLITVKPENLIVEYQPDLVFDDTRTLAQMLSDPSACYSGV